MEVSQGVVSYRSDEGVRVGRATVEKVSGQMTNAEWTLGFVENGTFTADSTQRIPASFRSRVFYLIVCYPQIPRLKYAEI